MEPPIRNKRASQADAGRRQPPRRLHERDLLAVCGLPAVEALFATDPARVERLFFEPRHAAALARPRQILGRRRKPYREVPSDELALISGTIHHGGAVAIARPRPLPLFDPDALAVWASDGTPLLILDGVGNPHNLGAIARTAAYFGIKRLMLADRPEQALPSAASYRVAEGGLDRLELCRAALPTALVAIRKHFHIVGTSPARGLPLPGFHGSRPIALILGNEEQGVAASTLRSCDTIVAIPGAGTGVSVESLNVAAAAAILLYALTSA
jgi:TrmH RNA methyltransferase